jgi:hypothetical protein
MDGGGRRLPVDGNCGQPPADGLRGRPRRPADGHPFRQSEGGQPPPSVGRGGRRTADSLTVRQADVRGIVGCDRTSGGRGRGRPDA